MSVSEYTDRKWNLIVVGGGMTGVAAAVAARRLGLDVLILEKAGFLGGAAATCLINPFMPFATEVDGKRFDLSRGFFTELRRILRETDGFVGGDEYNTTLHEEYIKIALDRLVVKEDIAVLYHAMLSGVEKEGETILRVKMATKAGELSFAADIFIDCTGDADLAMLAGCPFRLGREDGLCQPMTLCFRIANVDLPTYRKNYRLMQELYKQHQAEGKIKNPREDVLVFYTQVDGMLHFNTTRVVKHNPTDPLDVTRAEMIAREQMLEMYTFLRDNIPGFEKSQLLYSASEIGVRESRMIEGEYVLNEEDLKNCVAFEDAIAAGNYDIDIHNPDGSGTSHYFFPKGTWYTIPYRSLLPKDADNLLVAGRCISATHAAQASIRIMPIVTTLGEAAGVAAAIAKKSGVKVKQVDVKALRQQLLSQGAFIG
ncbi:MAG: FAD-dependent oxidoreductase [Christensenellales bacterium]|jgi:hypothetical protein